MFFNEINTFWDHSEVRNQKVSRKIKKPQNQNPDQLAESELIKNVFRITSRSMFFYFFERTPNETKWFLNIFERKHYKPINFQHVGAKTK